MAVLALLAAAGWYRALDRGTAPPAYRATQAPPTAQRSTDAATSAPSALSPVLGAVVAIDDGFDRRAAMHRHVAALSLDELHANAAQAAGIEDAELRAETLAIVYAAFVGRDAGRALSSLLALPLGPDRNQHVRDLFTAWAERDLRAALAAVTQLGDDSLVQAAGDGVLLGYVRPDALIDADVLRLLPADF